MYTEVSYVVSGVTEDGYGWHEPQAYHTFEEANAQAEHWAKYEPEVWVEKITTTRETVSTPLPPREHIPA